MPPTNTTADRVMMRLAEEIQRAIQQHKKRVLFPDEMKECVAAALSAHGVREMVEAGESLIDGSMLAMTGATYVPRRKFERFEKAFADLLGEGETLKAEEQADGR